MSCPEVDETWLGPFLVLISVKMSAFQLCFLVSIAEKYVVLYLLDICKESWMLSPIFWPRCWFSQSYTHWISYNSKGDKESFFAHLKTIRKRPKKGLFLFAPKAEICQKCNKLMEKSNRMEVKWKLCEKHCLFHIQSVCFQS